MQPNPAPSGNTTGGKQSKFIINSGSTMSRIEKWVIKPLKKLNSHHDVFVSLTALFPLYEKQLRHQLKMKPEVTFSKGHKVFNIIGKDLNLSKTISYMFWNDWRNGLLHKFMPKNTNLGYIIEHNADQICEYDKQTKTVIFNPQRFGDLVLEKIRTAKKLWKDEDFPLFNIFERP